MPVIRHASVPGPRLAGWLERFEQAHGQLVVQPGDEGLIASAAGGARAVLRAPWPDDGRPGRGTDEVTRLAALAAQTRPVALVLVRRAGWAVGVASEGTLVASKSGGGRGTSGASGGSRQRQDRRRTKQVDALAEASAAAAAACFTAAADAGARPQYLRPGGDRLLVAQVLEQQQLQQWRRLPLLPPIQVQEPNTASLRKAAVQSCAVTARIELPD